MDEIISRQNEKKTNRVFILYTICFLFIFTFTLGLLLLAGKSLIFQDDPYNQHLPAVYYFSDYMRTGLSDLLHGKLNFPSWDMGIGFGGDVLGTLNYYAFGDPLNLLYILVKPDHVEYMYIFLAGFRMYLAGFSFIIFSRFFKHGKYPLILGALVYSFSGFAMVSATMHPFFLNAMIYLPLALLGIEKIFRNKSPLLFISTISISLISNFYFSYMIILISFIYALVRYFSFFETRSIKHFFGLLGKFILFMLDSLLISSIVLIPVMYEFLRNGRSGFGSEQSLISYSLAYYVELFQTMFSPTAGSHISMYWTNISIAVISFLALLVSILYKRNRTVLILLLISFITLLSPLLGKIMNGFSYPSNRWVFALIFLLSYMVTLTLPSIVTLTRRKLSTISIITFLYILIIFLLRPMFHTVTMLTIINFLFILSVILFLSLQENLKSSRKQRILFLFSLLSITLMMFYKTYPKANTNFDLGSSIKMIKTSPLSLSKEVKDADEYRTSIIRDNRVPSSTNASLVTKGNGLANYFSLTPDGTASFVNSTNISSQLNQIIYYDLDNRQYLETLFSTKYLATDNQNATIPFDYKLISSSEKDNFQGTKTTYRLYQKKNFLPIGYSYTESLSKEEFNTLSPIEKQEALLQKVVLEKTKTKQPTSTGDYHSQKVDYKIVETDGISIENNTIIVKKPNAKMVLSFDGLPNSETYFYLKGITNFSPKDYTTSTKRDFDRFTEKFNRFYSTPVTKSKITAQGLSSNSRTIYSKENKYVTHLDNALINVGYSKEKQSKITVNFGSTGTIDFKDMQVVCQPMDYLPEQIQTLTTEPFQLKSKSNDQITGEVNFSTERFLAFSIPYSKGWSLSVDGQPYELEKANLMFMGASVPPGNHQIQLIYHSPGKKLGGILTALGVISLIVSLHIRKKKIKE